MPDTVLPPMPTAPSSGFLVILSPTQWSWLVQAFRSLHTDNEIVVQSLSPLTHALEGVMTQNDRILADVAANTAAVAAVGDALTAVATGVAKEIADLARAVAALGTVDPGVNDALQALEASNTRLAEIASQAQGLNTSLAADDEPATP